MPRRPLLLGLDVGTSRVKALLVDGDGTACRAAAVDTPFTARPAGTEMTVDALVSALRRVLDGLGDARGRVAAVGIAGLAESGAPLDAGGRPLAPVIAWHDPRGAEVVARLEARFGAPLAFRIGQPVRTVSSVAKLGWLVDHGVAGVHAWSGVPELCLFALTGAHTTDYSLAARTGCYDVGRRRWLPEVAAAAGFSVTVFPTVQPAGRALGQVSGAAEWSGLPPGVPVTLAGHDHLAALAGSGAAGSDLGNSVGTAETVVGRADRLPDVESALALRVAVTVAPTGEGWAVFAGAARAGRILDTAARSLGRSPAELDDLAESAGAVDVSDMVEALTAGRDPGPAPGGPGETWNGLLAMLVARTDEAVGRALDLVGPARRLVVFGGGSRSRPWLRAKAEACRLPMWRSTAGEAAARGAAIYAGMAADWWPSTEEAPRAALEEVET